MTVSIIRNRKGGNKSSDKLLGCTHFAICPGTLRLFSLSVGGLMQCQRGLQISRVKNIVSVFEFSGVALRLDTPSVWALLQTLQSLNIHFWWMALFFFDFIEAVLCATPTLELMPPKYILA